MNLLRPLDTATRDSALISGVFRIVRIVKQKKFRMLAYPARETAGRSAPTPIPVMLAESQIICAVLQTFGMAYLAGMGACLCPTSPSLGYMLMDEYYDL